MVTATAKHGCRRGRAPGAAVLAVSAVCAIGASGCVSGARGIVFRTPGPPGIRRLVIVGFGFVQVPDGGGDTAVTASDQVSLGLYASDQPGVKFGLGYQACTVTTVHESDRAEDVRVEVIRGPGRRLTVAPQSARWREAVDR